MSDHDEGAILTDAHPDLQRELRFFPIRNERPSILTPGQIHHFNQKGYISRLPVFSRDEMAIHRANFDRLLEVELREGRGSYAINGRQHELWEIYDLAKEPRILDYVQDLIGENIICWATHYFCKLPGDGKAVSWHQDASYWPVTPSKTVTVWLAIDDADTENGCMCFIPGSHVHGQIPFVASAPEEGNVLDQTVADAERYGDSPFDVELEAGEISLHSDLMLHASNPNTSTRRRCGLTLRYAPPEVRAYKGRNLKSMICRGADPTGHWANVPRPPAD